MIDLTHSAAKAAARKRAALANLTGVKEAHAERASELWEAKINHRQAAKMRETEFDLTVNHHLDLYVTPVWLADEMVARADWPLYSGSLWCEPSAGTGRLVQAMVDAGHTPFCIELNYNAAAHLQAKFPGLVVYNQDFLDINAEPVWLEAEQKIILPRMADVFIMNPPFSHGQDIDHVRHAFNLLYEGGKIVSVMSERTFYASDKKALAFRTWFNEIGGQSEKLPADTFKESGTGVQTRLIEIDK